MSTVCKVEGCGRPVYVRRGWRVRQQLCDRCRGLTVRRCEFTGCTKLAVPQRVNKGPAPKYCAAHRVESRLKQQAQSYRAERDADLSAEAIDAKLAALERAQKRLRWTA